MVSRCRISRCVIDTIQRAAAEDPAREVCGLLFGGDGEITDVQVTENIAENPDRYFEIDPRALFAALRAERAGGPKLAGYWHSHPSGDATPSATDEAMSDADGKLWLIVAGDTVGAWRADPAGLAAVPLEIMG